MVGAEGHLGDHNAEGAHPQKPSRHHSCPELAHYTWLQDTRVAEWEADSHITVQGHSHEHPRLHGGKGMDEEQLDETGMVFNLMSMKPGWVEEERTRSVIASMARKRYMGSCRVWSVRII